MSFLRAALHALTACALLSVAACDSNVPDDSSPSATANTQAGSGNQGTSSIDGLPIVTIDAADLTSDVYGQLIRSSVVDRKAGVQSALAAVAATSDEAPLLRDVLAGAASSTGASLPSTHIVIKDGSTEEFVLTARFVTGTSVGEAFVVMNPEVFEPDSDRDGKSASRTFPGTRLSDGREVLITATGGTASAVPKRGNAYAAEPVGDIILIDALPILDVSTTAFIPSVGSASSFNGSGFFGSHPFVGLRRLRVDEKHDGGVFPWSEKQEVQLTAEIGDNYTVPFQRSNTRRFDKAFWTNISSWPIFPPGGVGTQSTFNPVLANFVPVSGGTKLTHLVWFLAQDVNYADQTYVFGTQRFELCDYAVTNSCNKSPQSYEFPLTFLASSTPKQRSFLNEDDRNVDLFSRRSGDDWVGTIQTYNFGTGTTSGVSTKVDAANHSITTDDRVFVRSGLRGMTQATVQSRAGSNGVTLNVGQLQWELSYSVLNV